MAKNVPLKPGSVLHATLMGLLKARGLTLKAWAHQNDVKPESMRMATHGLWGGQEGTNKLNELIDYVGRPLVTQIYQERINDKK